MTQTKQTYKYSEIFHSFQGEGCHTGKSTAWIRFFLCNLQCSGFGQKDPTDPSTYVLPYKDFDVSSIDRIEDLPVWDYGCDSSYTWAKKYRHLAHNKTSADICDEISSTLKTPDNPLGLFVHPITKQSHHLAFTGGEPMLNQQAMHDIIKTFRNSQNFPRFVTVETNGTIPVEFSQDKTKFGNYIKTMYSHVINGDTEFFWSVSPKLFSTSGESPKKAIKPEAVATYALASDRGQLKYVVDGSPESWKEVEEHTAAFRAAGVQFPVYIMPVGATKEQQEEDVVANICTEAMRRGYHVSGRLHAYVFGNQIGT